MTGSVVRVLALWSPDWPVTAAAHAARVPPHQPAAVFVAGRVLACSAVARAQGVRRGLRRREAQARCPDLAVLTPDPDRDARAFEPVVAAVEELAPGVEILRPGLVALPARGPAGWFGGELAAAERLVDQVAARTGAEVQAGFADGLFAAVLAARRAVAVAPGDTPAFLAALGVEELDREPDIDRSALVDLLRRLGLLSLGAFAALDPADVASRFGADAVLCHRLARGLDPRPPLRRQPPEELAVEAELDPPVDRVDAAAFAARGLAERLHATLAGHGLACTRLGVTAHTAAGEELHRIWRCAEPLTPAATVDRVRWQLDAWLTNRRDTPREGAVVRLRLVPEETVAAGALQRGLWGETGEADERAGRALVRVQALLGPESVVTAVRGGGRDPAERVRLVPWGDERAEPAAAAPAADARRPGGAAPAHAADPARHPGPADLVPDLADAAPAGWPVDVLHRTGRLSAVELLQQGGQSPAPRSRRRRLPAHRSPRPSSVPEPPPSWPGRLPAPSPATVPPAPLPALVHDAADEAVRLDRPDLLTAPPARVAVDGRAPAAVVGWSGPWPVWARWWSPEATPTARMQVVLDDGTALLLVAREGRWWVHGDLRLRGDTKRPGASVPEAPGRSWEGSQATIGGGSAAPVMIATASDIVCDCGVITVARLPSRWMWMRSATSNTCGMLWLIRMTGRPRSRTSRISCSTRLPSLTPSAAVGSSRMTTLLPNAAERATATACRCPPDRLSTACPMFCSVPRPARSCAGRPRTSCASCRASGTPSRGRRACVPRGRGTGCRRCPGPAPRPATGTRSRCPPGGRPSGC